MMNTQTGGAIKALGDDRVAGYLVLWGNKQQADLHGEYFTPQTDLALDLYEERPLLYQHGLDETMKLLKVGTITSLKADAEGLWMEAQLDLRKKYASAVMKLVKRGVLGLSSGALPHLVEVDASGQIKRWPIVEGSMTPTPAEPRIVAEAMKSIKMALAEETTETGASGAVKTAAVEAASENSESNRQSDVIGALKMNEELLMQLMSALEAAGVTLTDEQKQAVAAQFQQAAQEGEASATLSAPEVTAIRAYLETGEGDVPEAATRAIGELSRIARGIKAQAGLVAAARNPQPRVTGGYSGSASNIRVASKFDSLKAIDMAYAAEILNSMPGRKVNLSLEFRRAFAEKVEREQMAIPDHAREAIKAWRADGSALKANELDHSTQAGYGDEWVPTMWDSSLWERVRVDNAIASSIPNIEMPSNPYKLPVESSDPTVYLVPETTAESELLISGSGAVIPDSKLGTADTTLTAKKLALRVGFSSELEEDSIIPFAAQLNKQAQRTIADATDNVILNGDTDATASTNINLSDGTPSATAKYLIFNGLRQLPLITTTANTVDGGGISPTLSLIRRTRFTLAAAYALRPADLRLVCDASTYAKLLSMPEFITMDKAGNLATALTGQVGYVDGMPVIVSAEMGLATATGLIAGSGNTLGSLVIYAPEAWKLGYIRRAKVVSEYISYYDSYQLTATVRLALTRQNADCAAILVNLAV